MTMMTGEGSVLEVIRYASGGYTPLLFSAGWQVAILNWEPAIDMARLKGVGELERHAQTDEVFGLWRGRAALYVQTGQGIQMVDLEPGVIYNVTAGGWHNLVASRDVSLWIVENRDTHLHDTELRPMTAEEKNQVLTQLPDWARQGEAGVR